VTSTGVRACASDTAPDWATTSDDTTPGYIASISLVAGLAPGADDHRTGRGLLREELPAALAP